MKTCEYLRKGVTKQQPAKQINGSLRDALSRSLKIQTKNV